jgi:putative serine protease PepD
METTVSDHNDAGTYPEPPEAPEDPWSLARPARPVQHVPEWSQPEAPAQWVPELPDSAEPTRPGWTPGPFPSFTAPEPKPSAPPSSPAGAEAAPPRRGWLRRVAPLVALSLLAGAAGGAISQAIEGDDEPAAAPVAQTPSVGSAGPSQRLAGDPLDVAGVVAAVEPAVASIEVRFGSGGFGLTGVGAGTGFVLTADGDVLTNAHVVEGATEIFVTLAGESQSHRAELVGADAANDLALLRITDASGLPVAPLGRSADVAVGDDAVAIGNALGLRGGPSVTKGIISALGRSLETDTGVMTGLIQTDASISSGNSGGPLVNAAGEVIGINTAVARGSATSAAENIGFAIPIDKALPIVERLRGGGPAPVVGFLGVRSSNPADGSRGASIVSVEPGSPAEKAGIQEGDLITHINGDRVDGAAELGGLVQGYAPGDKVTVSLIRAGTKQEVEVTLAPRQ